MLEKETDNKMEALKQNWKNSRKKIDEIIKLEQELKVQEITIKKYWKYYFQNIISF